MIIKGFIEKNNTILSINKLDCLNYPDVDFIKDFDLSNYKTIQIINIKGFKAFLRNKDIQEFKDITLINNQLEFKGITFKKGVTDNNYNYIEILDNDNNRIVCINLDLLKPIFREFKNNYINSLRLFYTNDFPAYFEININEGFLIAPMILND